jgi:hypothetical protein
VKFHFIIRIRKKLVHVLCEKQKLHLSARNLFINIHFLGGAVDITGALIYLSCELP